MKNDGERLILASKSAARRAVLTDAGVPFTVQVADVDEDALKTPGVDPVTDFASCSAQAA